MTDWSDHLGRSRRHLEPLFWVLAAATVAMLAAASAALALWLDPEFGQKDAESRVVVIDLTTLPPVEMVAAEPPPAPLPDPVPPEPEPEVQPKSPAPDSIPAPKPLVKPVLKPDPQPKPEPKPEPKPDPEPAPKPKPKPDPKPKAEKKPDRKPTRKAEAPAARVAAAPVQGSAQASAMAKWKRKVQGQMASHVKRTRAGAKAKLVLSVQIDGAGRMMAVSVRQSSGDAGLDARIAAHAQARGSVAAPPDGKGTTLILPITLG